MDAATHEVLRVIPGPGGRDIYGGTQVDASGWANLRQLEEAGYLRRLSPPDPPAPEAAAAAASTMTSRVEPQPVPKVESQAPARPWGRKPRG